MPKVFVSYIRENSDVVLKLARELENYGIEVWLDKNEIKPGTRWQDSIRNAIGEGDFFIACFSEDYIKRNKSYMNTELTLAIEELNQRPTDRAWFIPVLLSDCDIPNRSIGANETLRSIQWVELYKSWHRGIRSIVSVILPEAVWEPYELEWADGSAMVVLPLRPAEEKVLCIGKYPVTNAQYKSILGKRPRGKHLYNPEVSLEWTAPFYPWKEEAFNSPDKPVVCVSYEDALRYSGVVNKMHRRMSSYACYTTLPTPHLWDFAAFGTEFPSHDPQNWFTQSREIHHKDRQPAAIDAEGKRLNQRGVSDMIGNVWEWCLGVKDYEIASIRGASIRGSFLSALFSDSKLRQKPRIELRGGGFFDDMSRVSPFLNITQIKDGADTRHSDLGFRIAAEVEVDILPSHIRQKLSAARFSARSFLVENQYQYSD